MTSLSQTYFRSMVGKDLVYIYKLTSGLYAARSIVFGAVCVDFNPDRVNEKLFFVLSNQHIDLNRFRDLDVTRPIEVSKRRRKSEDADDLLYIYEGKEGGFVAQSCFFHREGVGSTRNAAITKLNKAIGSRLLRFDDRDRSEPVAAIDVEVPIRNERMKLALFN